MAETFPQQSISRSRSALLLFLLALFFAFNRGPDLLFEALAFCLLIAYQWLTDWRFTGEQIREAGLLIPHIVLYLALCTLVVWVTTGDEESPYWIIFLLPVAVAAANLGLAGTLLTCSASAAIFALLVPIEVFRNPATRAEELPELLVFGVTFFLVGLLIQAFSEQHRRQLATQKTLNTALEQSLVRLQEAEEGLRRQERLAALGEMAAGLAHEIRNPLGIISSSVQLLERKLNRQGSAQHQLFAIIQEETLRLNDLVADFLTFGRPLTLNRRPGDLRDLADRCLKQVQALAEQRGIALTAVLTEQPLTAVFDGERLQQTLLNLLLNALEASPAGGRVEVRLTRERDAAAIVVQDAGCGIPPENLSRIFNPFFTTKDKGTGLGLANAHKIAELHGGALTVASLPGKGSTFTLRIPREDR